MKMIWFLLLTLLPVTQAFSYPSVIDWKNSPLIVFENSPLTNKIKTLIFSKISQILILVITLLLMIKGFSIPFFINEFYSVLFGIIICNFAVNERRLFSMENNLTNYLGKISYGLYMFHPICIVITIKLSQYFNTQNNYFVYPVVYILTILIASLSYELFEKMFIDKKVKYSVILSGDNAKEQ